MSVDKVPFWAPERKGVLEQLLRDYGGAAWLKAPTDAVRAALKEVDRLDVVENGAYDAIFPLVPEAHDEQGRPLSVAGKIERLAGMFARLSEENARRKQWQDAVMTVADKAFALGGCCHEDMVCQRIQDVGAARNELEEGVIHALTLLYALGQEGDLDPCGRIQELRDHLKGLLAAGPAGPRVAPPPNPSPPGDCQMKTIVERAQQLIDGYETAMTLLPVLFPRKQGAGDVITASVDCAREMLRLTEELKQRDEKDLRIAQTIGEVLPLTVPHRGTVDALKWLAETVDFFAKESEARRAELAKVIEERDAIRDEHRACGRIQAYVKAVAAGGTQPVEGVSVPWLDDLLSDRERLKQEVRLHRDKAAGDYWAWQGDGTDHLETLTCPVLISPRVLSALFSEHGRLARRTLVLERACRLAIEDRQCSQKCDGPHADCPCWYCTIANALVAPERVPGKVVTPAEAEAAWHAGQQVVVVPRTARTADKTTAVVGTAKDLETRLDMLCLAAELALGGWTNVKMRDSLQAVLLAVNENDPVPDPAAPAREELMAALRQFADSNNWDFMPESRHFTQRWAWSPAGNPATLATAALRAADRLLTRVPVPTPPVSQEGTKT